MQPSRREETGSTSCNVVPVKQIPRPLRAQQPGSMNGPVERVHLRKCSRGSQQRDADALANGPNMRQQSCVDPLRARTLSLVMFFFHLGSLSLTVRGMLTHTCGTRRSSPGRRLLPVGCSTGDPGKHGTGCNCNPPPPRTSRVIVLIRSSQGPRWTTGGTLNCSCTRARTCIRALRTWVRACW